MQAVRERWYERCTSVYERFACVYERLEVHLTASIDSATVVGATLAGSLQIVRGQLVSAWTSDARAFTCVYERWEKHLTASRDLGTGVVVTLAGNSQIVRRQLGSAWSSEARAFTCVYERLAKHLTADKDLGTVVGATLAGSLQIVRWQLVSAWTSDARAFTCVYERFACGYERLEKHMEASRDSATAVGATAVGATLAGSWQIVRGQLGSAWSSDARAFTCVYERFACGYERWEEHLTASIDSATVVGATLAGSLQIVRRQLEERRYECCTSVYERSACVCERWEGHMEVNRDLATVLRKLVAVSSPSYLYGQGVTKGYFSELC